jgi:hypothetical protein
MADGRSRKAAATKKAAAAKSEARAARPRKVVDAANVQPKMGIAQPPVGAKVTSLKNALLRQKRAARGYLQGAPGTTPKPYDTGNLGPIPSAPTGAHRLNAPKLKQGVQQPVNVRDNRGPGIGAHRNQPMRDMTDKRGDIIGTRPDNKFSAYSRARQVGALPIPKIVVRASGKGRAAKAAATKKKK